MLPVCDAGQFGGEFHALGFAAGERRGRLAQRKIAEANFLQAFERAGNLREVFEHSQRLVDPQIEHIGDRKALVANLQRLPVEPFPFAHRADYVQIGQELHLDFLHALPLAFLAPAPFHVEAEAAGLVAALLGLARAGEHFAYFVKNAQVGGRIAPRRAANGRLIDHDNLVDLTGAAQAGVRTRLGP